VQPLANLNVCPPQVSKPDASRLDVSSLRNKLVFQSDSAHEVRSELSGMLSEHALTLGRGRVNTQLFASWLNDISIMKLSYGAEVDIKAMAFDGFSLVQTPLQGRFEADTEGVKCCFGPGDVAVLSPRRDIDIHWQQGSEQIIVKIPHRLLAPHDTHDDQHSPRGIHPPCRSAAFALPVFKLHPGLTPLWHALVQQAINLSDSASPASPPSRSTSLPLDTLPLSTMPLSAMPLSTEWLAHFERTLGLFVLAHQDCGAAHKTERYNAERHSGLPRAQKRSRSIVQNSRPPIQPPESATLLDDKGGTRGGVWGGALDGKPEAHDTVCRKKDDTPLARMQAYMHQHLCAPISLVELAQAAGVSPRSLNTLCQRRYGVSPMMMLRNLRLDAVHDVLRSRPATHVTSVALDHGFGHLGRFSAYYRQRFGELPRTTTAAVAAAATPNAPPPTPQSGTCTRQPQQVVSCGVLPVQPRPR